MMPMSSFPATTDADKAYAMKAAEFRSAPNTPEGMAMLRQATQGPFGSLALIEIDKRTRAELMEAVKKQNANMQDTNLLQQALQRETQARMMNRMADDERMGLNNLVSQAEQGSIQFGAPVGQQAQPAPQAAIGQSQGAMPMGAGGGIIAFQKGAYGERKDQEDADDEDDIPVKLRKAPRTREPYPAGVFPKIQRAGRDLMDYTEAIQNRIAGGVKSIGSDIGEGVKSIGSDIGDFVSQGRGLDYYSMGDQALGGTSPTTPTPAGPPVSAVYPDETKRGSSSVAASGQRIPNRVNPRETAAPSAAPSVDRTGIARLAKLPEFETDVEKIISKEDELMAKMGLGEYGAKARESMADRRRKAEELYGRAMGSESFLAAAEAAGGGGKRMSGLQALAASVGAAGKAAAGIKREERAALDKITEGEEKLMLAEDLYKRGQISEANKAAREGQRDLFNAQIQMDKMGLQEREIMGKEKYYDALIANAGAKGAGTFKGGDVARLNEQYLETLERLRLEKDPKIQAILQEQLARLKIAADIALTGGIQIGTR